MPRHTEEAVIEAALIADRHASIRQRLMNVVMRTTLLALLVSAAVLLVYEMRADRAATVRELRAQAEFVTRASLPVQDLTVENAPLEEVMSELFAESKARRGTVGA